MNVPGACVLHFTDAVVYFFKENKKLFQEYLDEKKVFKSLFFQNIYDPTKDERRIKQMEREADLKRRADERERRAEMRRRRLAELAEGGEEIVDQFVDEEESEEDEEDELYFGPPPVSISSTITHILFLFGLLCYMPISTYFNLKEISSGLISFSPQFSDPFETLCRQNY